MTETIWTSVRNALAGRDWHSATALMRQLLRTAPNPATAQFILNCFEHYDSRPDLPTYRVAFLRSFTLEPIIPLLRAMAALHGIWLSAYLSDFNTYAQEILDESSELYKFDPQVVVLAVQLQDSAPEIWDRYARLSLEDIKGTVEATLAKFENLIDSFRVRHQAHMIVHNFEPPALPALGLLDSQVGNGQIEVISEMNRSLSRIAARAPGVYVLDYDSLVARFGRLRWRDERKWLSARMPISTNCLIHLAEEYLRFLLPLTGRTCKALVVDLDNTIWGGVIGEDGLNGIHLGSEYPGAAFLALQSAILDLHNRGIILAICSKNNPADALEALENHPRMLLRPHHFAATRINWSDKVQNLREIAEELNIGVDALAFLDDSPQERERIRRELPEVHVIDLPNDPMEFSLTLRQCPVFERLKLSTEDRERSRYYVEERQRRELEKKTPSLEDFYRSLQIVAEVGPVDVHTLARVAQLTQKTNQFNLTSRRYSEQQIGQLLEDSDCRVYYLRAGDKFGDSGVVGVAMMHKQLDSIEIENFLLSCRVIGRTLETAFLAYLAQEAMQQGARWLRGRFVPTKKNAPAKDFYPSHRFQLDKSQENGESLWVFDLQNEMISIPDWIDCKFTYSCLQNQ